MLFLYRGDIQEAFYEAEEQVAVMHLKYLDKQIIW